MCYTISMTAQETKNIERLAAESAALARKSLKKSNELEAYLGLLDYRAGKLLGTVVNRVSGQIGGFAEVDLVKEFGIPPRTDCHFMMTTGVITRGQAALYVAEVNSGRFGVYTMVPGENGAFAGGIQIRRHDMVAFRSAQNQKREVGANP